MMRIIRSLALSGASALALLSLSAAPMPAAAQSPVVQPQYFGAPVNSVVSVDLEAAASRPLGQSAFAGGQPSGTSAASGFTYGQRVQAEASPPMFTGAASQGRSARP